MLLFLATFLYSKLQHKSIPNSQGLDYEVSPRLKRLLTVDLISRQNLEGKDLVSGLASSSCKAWEAKTLLERLPEYEFLSAVHITGNKPPLPVVKVK